MYQNGIAVTQWVSTHAQYAMQRFLGGSGHSHIKSIKSAHDHETALFRLMSLMDLDPQPSLAESDDMDVLASLIEKYEEEHFPISKPVPIEAIKVRMEQQSLKNIDLFLFY